jgi:hypothetical protein
MNNSSKKKMTAKIIKQIIISKMGNISSCDHKNTTTVEKIGEYNWMFWRYENWKTRCNDCPKELIVQKKIGRMTKFEYKSEDIHPKTCEHKHFDIIKETTTDEGKAGAKCKTCGFKFWVELNGENQWMPMFNIKKRDKFVVEKVHVLVQ